MKLRCKNDLPSEGLDIETLMEALFYRDEFLSIASHELRTPLTSIKLQAQVFKRQSVYSPEKVDRMVEQIDQQTNRLMRLVDDMLDISRIRSGQLTMTKSLFNLSELIFEVVSAYPLESSIVLKVEKNVHLYGDRDRIAQALDKLLNNAARFGMGRPIEVKLVKRSKITLSVTDQGEGLSKEDQKRIFHRFQRAVAASEISGLGLGLYISRAIVEGHGGKISVKSELEKGSTFKMKFKLQESA